VLASRAAGIEPPIDSVYPLLDDADGLRDQAVFARSLGFFGKSAIHPSQLDILHEVFTPTAAEIDWALSVLDGFERVGGAGFALPTGEFVDLPVADRARRLLDIAGVRPMATSTG
jgi:citrate lyase subunit beta/citryl-CoA lyase